MKFLQNEQKILLKSTPIRIELEKKSNFYKIKSERKSNVRSCKNVKLEVFKKWSNLEFSLFLVFTKNEYKRDLEKRGCKKWDLGIMKEQEKEIYNALAGVKIFLREKIRRIKMRKMENLINEKL